MIPAFIKRLSTAQLRKVLKATETYNYTRPIKVWSRGTRCYAYAELVLRRQRKG